MEPATSQGLLERRQKLLELRDKPEFQEFLRLIKEDLEKGFLKPIKVSGSPSGKLRVSCKLTNRTAKFKLYNNGIVVQDDCDWIFKCLWLAYYEAVKDDGSKALGGLESYRLLMLDEIRRVLPETDLFVQKIADAGNEFFSSGQARKKANSHNKYVQSERVRKSIEIALSNGLEKHDLIAIIDAALVKSVMTS